MRWRVSFAAVVGTVVAVAAGCTVPSVEWRRPPAEPDAGSAGTVAWRDCGRDARRINSGLPRSLTIECGTVSVPRDWNAGGGGPAPTGGPSPTVGASPTAAAPPTAGAGQTLEIALMRVRSSRQADRIGSVLLNPGGPGSSGIEFVAYIAPELTGLLRRFDLIGFDPRGVGRSAPVDCISDADLDASFGAEPDPVSDAAFAQTVTLSRRIGQGCGARYGSALALYSTEQAARDMDAIRAAVGDEKLTYLGYSYGTLLGAVYARLFPTRIRSMVLDGAVDPREPPVAGSEAQARGFERAFDNFARWCRDAGRDCPIGPDGRSAVRDALSAARTSPVLAEDGRRATTGWIFTAVVSSLYSEEAWPYLARGIDGLRRGDPELVFLLADNYAERDENGRYSNLFDANNAVNCTDSDQFPTVETIRSLQSQWRARYPLFGAPLALGMLSCALWPGQRDPYPVGPATGSPPIVVVGTTGDPATPYEATPKLSELLGTGTVVTWRGEGHTAYPTTDCIRDAIDGYLIDGTVPAAGLTCPAR